MKIDLIKVIQVGDSLNQHWLCCFDLFLNALRLVRETTSREDEQQHGCDERNQDGRQAVEAQLRRGQQMGDVGAPTIAGI